MNFLTIFGLIAALFTTFAFLPQVIKTWRLKKTSHISLGMYIVQCIGNLLWFIYGLLIFDIPLIFANGTTFTMAFIVLILKLKYK